MKRLFVLFAALIVGSFVFAQEKPTITHTFSYKKGQEAIVLDKINTYITEILALEMPDAQSFVGEINPLYCNREGNHKDSYSVRYKAKYAVNAGKASFDFWLTDIEHTAIICDRSQAIETKIMDPSGNYPKVLDRFEYISDDIVDHIRDYVKKDEKYKPRIGGLPYWWDMQYIVENGSVTYYKVLSSSKNLPREELYKIFENYFTYAYRSGKSVIENKNPEDFSIIAKGIYGDVHQYNGMCVEDYDISHVVSVQCRDGRVRVSFIIGDYDIRRTGNKYVSSGKFTRNIAAYEPFGSERDEEMEECLEKLEARLLAQFVEMQKAMDEGNTAVDTLDDW